MRPPVRVGAAVLLALLALLAVHPPGAGGASEGARARLDRALRGLKDARTTFTQVRSAGALGSQTSRGTLEYRAPRQLRLDYQGSAALTVLVRGDTAWVHQPSAHQVLRSPTNRAGAPPLPFLKESMAVVEQACRVRETGPSSLRLEPRDPAASPWRSIDLTLDAATGLPARMDVAAPADTVSLRFGRYRVNAGVAASRFAPVFPPGTAVVEL